MEHSRPRPKYLANKLLQIRRSLGVSQGELVRQLGVQVLIDHTTISKYELDKTNLRSPLCSPMLAWQESPSKQSLMMKPNLQFDSAERYSHSNVQPSQ